MASGIIDLYDDDYDGGKMSTTNDSKKTGNNLFDIVVCFVLAQFAIVLPFFLTRSLAILVAGIFITAFTFVRWRKSNVRRIWLTSSK